MGFLFSSGGSTVHTTDQQLGSFRVQTSSQGLPVPIVYGNARITPNLGWYGDFTSIAHTSSQSSGGKGGGGGSKTTVTTTTYTYTVGVMLLICEGEISGYGKVWKDKTLTTTAALGFSEFYGFLNQIPWSYLTSHHPSQALALRGQAYLANGALDLGSNNILPNISVEVYGLLANFCPPDINIADIIYDLFPSDRYGASFPSAMLPYPSDFWNYCYAAGLRASPVYSTQRAANDILTELCQMGNCAPIWSEEQLKLIPFADDVVESSTLGGDYWQKGAYSSSLGLAVIIGTGGHFLLTSDGVNFEVITAPVNGPYHFWNGIAWSPSRGEFLVTQFQGQGTAISSDGYTWVVHSMAMPTTDAAFCPVWCPNINKYVVALGSYIASSSDGISWTTVNPGFTAFGFLYGYSGIAYSDTLGQIIANGDNSYGSIIIYSSDASTWHVGLTTSSFNGIESVWDASAHKWISGKYISSNGISWTFNNVAVYDSNAIGAYSSSLGVVVLSYSTIGLKYTRDGVNWRVINLNLDSQTGLIQGVMWASGLGMFIATGSNNCIDYVWTSKDGLNWTAQGTPRIANGSPYTPNTTINYDLTDDDFLPLNGGPVKVTRKRQADAFNQVQIECLDRSNSYNPVVVEAKDQANIEDYGLRPMQLIQLHAICDPVVGKNLAQLILQRALYIRNQYEFIIGWKYARLEPMDLVSLTDIGVGLVQYPVRILSIEENENGDLQIVAEDFKPGTGSTNINAYQQGSGSQQNTGVSAGNCSTPVIFQPPITYTQKPEVYIGTAGQPGSNWGGAQVWVSNDNSTYSQIGIITNPARIGTLSANFPIGSDPDVTNNLSVDLSEYSGVLVTASATQANAGETISYVDGELVAYSTATLTSDFNYTMSDMIRRGLYQSPITSHQSGAFFMRLDDAVLAIPLNSAWIGTQIYIKLLSFNTTGDSIQALSDVNPYTYTPVSEGLTPADGVLALIASSQQMTIQSGYQYNVANRLTIYGRVINFGQIRVIP